MSAPCAVSIVLSTFNRASMLGPAIDRLARQEPGTPAYEVIIVDNNSTDDTRAVVERRIATGKLPLQYVFEPRQGLSFARNAGIAVARSDVVAFTDDDVRVAPNWVATIRKTFDARPDIDCLGGRTLPVWPSTPPRWLTRLHWVGPLALQDYGDEPFMVSANHALCLAGANLAFRKRAFESVGLFSPDFPRSEDTELMLRFWLSGARALYVPDMLVHAVVQPERLTKRYHRSWHANIGRCNARMVLAELNGPGTSLRRSVPRFTRVRGVPLFIIRQLAGKIARYIVATVRRRPAEAVWHEVMARALVGHIRESLTIHRQQKQRLRSGIAGVRETDVRRERWCDDERTPCDRDRAGCSGSAVTRAVDG